MPDPERAPMVCRVFEEYATGRFTKQHMLHQARAWGPDEPPASWTYPRMVSARTVVTSSRISEALLYRVQAVLSGLVASTPPPQRAHPDFPLRGFVRCESCGRGLTGSWWKGPSPEVSLPKCATGPGLQVTLEIDRALFVRELDGDMKLPGAIACGVRAAASVVVGETARTSDVRPM